MKFRIGFMRLTLKHTEKRQQVLKTTNNWMHMHEMNECIGPAMPFHVGKVVKQSLSTFALS